MHLVGDGSGQRQCDAGASLGITICPRRTLISGTLTPGQVLV